MHFLSLDAVEVLQSLSGFTLREVLRNDPSHKLAFVLAVYNENGASLSFF